MTIDWIRNGKIDLALHHLVTRPGDPLLLLHGLGERTTPPPQTVLAAWPGPVYGLDFTGHGRSSVPASGGYSCEALLTDVDAALTRLGPTTILGRGLGGYLALLAAGARPHLTRGAIIADGPGLMGGASGPATPPVVVPIQTGGPPDPFALVELAIDPRPPQYALLYARQASAYSDVDPPVEVAAVNRPPWLLAVVEELAAKPTTVPDALARIAAS
jgi:pimeloyl-ACP methyl ester carboxylesterase